MSACTIPLKELGNTLLWEIKHILLSCVCNRLVIFPVTINFILDEKYRYYLMKLRKTDLMLQSKCVGMYTHFPHSDFSMTSFSFYLLLCDWFRWEEGAYRTGGVKKSTTHAGGALSTPWTCCVFVLFVLMLGTHAFHPQVVIPAPVWGTFLSCLQT